jgi:hypothetical protein
MCPDALFVESVLVPLEHENYCDHISCHRRTGMHYTTRKFHQIEKHKFSITCPNLFLSNPYQSHLSMKNNAVSFGAADALECTT